MLYLFDKNINNTRCFSSETRPLELTLNNLNYPSWLSGFVDGEGCFSISFTKRSASNLGIDVKPSFSLSQHIRSEACLYQIKNYFTCGGIRFDKNNQSYKYEIRNLTLLIQHILPHFEKYPLLTNKYMDFIKFSYICYLMKRKLHLNSTGLATIIDTAFTMNAIGKRKYTKQELLNILQVSKPSHSTLECAASYLTFNEFLSRFDLQHAELQRLLIQGIDNIKNLNYPSWLSGFVDGEGCFFVSLIEGKDKLRLIMTFQVDQYETSKKCMDTIKIFFGCGYIIHRKTKMLSFRLSSSLFIKNKIIPHFEKYPLLTSKSQSFIKFKNVFDITQGKSLNYTDPNFKQVIDLVRAVPLGHAHETKTRLFNFR